MIAIIGGLAATKGVGIIERFFTIPETEAIALFDEEVFRATGRRMTPGEQRHLLNIRRANPKFKSAVKKAALGEELTAEEIEFLRMGGRTAEQVRATRVPEPSRPERAPASPPRGPCSRTDTPNGSSGHDSTRASPYNTHSCPSCAPRCCS